jgi:hypothetical protein
MNIQKLLVVLPLLVSSQLTYSVEEISEPLSPEAFLNQRTAKNIEIFDAEQVKILSELKRDAAKANEETEASLTIIDKTTNLEANKVDNVTYKSDTDPNSILFSETPKEVIEAKPIPKPFVIPKLIKIVGNSAHFLIDGSVRSVSVGERYDDILLKKVLIDEVEIVKDKKHFTIGMDW